jgi:enoyl-[acyl-carrier-protein] reductase (NADH)
VEEMFEHRAPLHRPIESGDCGAAAAYLLSDDAKNVTGTTLYVDARYHAIGHVEEASGRAISAQPWS